MLDVRYLLATLEIAVVKCGWVTNCSSTECSVNITLGKKYWCRQDVISTTIVDWPTFFIPGVLYGVVLVCTILVVSIYCAEERNIHRSESEREHLLSGVVNNAGAP